MFESLFAKTFTILTLQLGITWLTTVLIITACRVLHQHGKLGLHTSTNEHGELDIHLDFRTMRPYFFGLIVLDIAVFICLVIWGRDHLFLGQMLFGLWSFLTGIELAISLLAVDENLGGKILAITTFITGISGLIGIYSGLDFSGMGTFLYWMLLLLLIGNITRLFISIPRVKQRIMAGIGSFIFVGYLLFDFNRLAAANTQALKNTWPVAMDFAIEIYLDIINLFLQLLDLISE